MGSTPKRAKLVRTLLRQAQPFPNHNGGHVVFGAGTTLYLGLGDGGSGDDPQRNGQKSSTKLAKILSANVTPANRPSWRTVAYGVRNPVAVLSYEAELNELWVADSPERDRGGEPRAARRDRTEPRVERVRGAASARTRTATTPPSGSGALIWPVITYEHGDDGCSITGGQNLRGSAIPALRGAATCTATSAAGDSGASPRGQGRRQPSAARPRVSGSSRPVRERRAPASSTPSPAAARSQTRPLAATRHNARGACPWRRRRFVRRVSPSSPPADDHPHKEHPHPMPQYATLIYAEDVDWSLPEHAEGTGEYGAFRQPPRPNSRRRARSTRRRRPPPCTRRAARTARSSPTDARTPRRKKPSPAST